MDLLPSGLPDPRTTLSSSKASVCQSRCLPRTGLGRCCSSALCIAVGSTCSPSVFQLEQAPAASADTRNRRKRVRCPRPCGARQLRCPQLRSWRTQMRTSLGLLPRGLAAHRVLGRRPCAIVRSQRSKTAVHLRAMGPGGGGMPWACACKWTARGRKAS